ncbi:MAG: NUDIX hydrolase [Alphaproteobacteria bacterium]|nr:NUDIX hydrolase [Alphaproteobacteria bacterium]
MDALIPASTILLVRDHPALEVLMVERHHQIDFASGALVFPGGKVSADDHRDEWAAHADGGFDGMERAFRVCAVREAFEESGLLMAREAAARGAGAAFVGAERIAPLEGLRRSIDKGETSFLETIRDAGLALALDALTPYAHWITPAMMKRRFDTRFYIAAAPGAQEALCDGSETVDATWISPAAAMAAQKAGTRTIIFPTLMNVEMLGRTASSQAAIAAAQSRTIVTVVPELAEEDGQRVLRIPAEAGYMQTVEKLDGVMNPQVKS